MKQIDQPKSAASRRSFLRTSAALGAGGLGVSAALNAQQTSAAGRNKFNPAPIPIPGGFNGSAFLGPRFPNKMFHFFLPGTGSEPSTIYNLSADVAIFNIHGTGTLTTLNPITGAPVSQTPNLPFATDVRFMKGIYQGVDGLLHDGAFAFF